MSLRDRLAKIESAVPKPAPPARPAPRLVLTGEAAEAVLRWHDEAGTELPAPGDRYAPADATTPLEELMD